MEKDVIDEILSNPLFDRFNQFLAEYIPQDLDHYSWSPSYQSAKKMESEMRDPEVLDAYLGLWKLVHSMKESGWSGREVNTLFDLLYRLKARICN